MAILAIIGRLNDDLISARKASCVRRKAALTRLKHLSLVMAHTMHMYDASISEWYCAIGAAYWIECKFSRRTVTASFGADRHCKACHAPSCTIFRRSQLLVSPTMVIRQTLVTKLACAETRDSCKHLHWQRRGMETSPNVWHHACDIWSDRGGVVEPFDRQRGEVIRNSLCS